jgi:hypothetical protein
LKASDFLRYNGKREIQNQIEGKNNSGKQIAIVQLVCDRLGNKEEAKKACKAKQDQNSKGKERKQKALEGFSTHKQGYSCSKSS